MSPTFLQNNQHQTLEDAIDELEKINNKGEAAGLDTVVYISMAFGNPYGDPWNVGEEVDAVELLESEGIRQSRSPTRSAWPGPHRSANCSAVNSKYDYLEIGCASAQPSRSGGGEDSGRV